MKSTSSFQLSGSRILVISGEKDIDQSPEAEKIRGVWRGPVDHISGATRVELLEAVRLGYPIVHFVAHFEPDHVVLQDGPISVVQFRELLKVANGRTQLIILAACDSYAVGKELENTGILYSVVATASLGTEAASRFFRSMYELLQYGYAPQDAFNHAYSMSIVMGDDRDVLPLYFTTHNSNSKTGPLTPVAAHSAQEQIPTTTAQETVSISNPPRDAILTCAPLTRASMRRLLSVVLCTDSDFDAFCLDYFGTAHARFSAGMDRTAKTNLLLQTEEINTIFARLCDHAPDTVFASGQRRV